MLRKVTVENGALRGIPAADPRITVFKGVPFAAPPVGELRWRSPEPAGNWEGVLTADTYAPAAMQVKPGLDPENLYSKEWYVDPDIPMSEDCLYLNIWTPAKKEDEKLPVMVWFHGGGMSYGYTWEMEFDGERIARRGVILVSVSYRLGAFGFLAHPELTSEDPNRSSGNYGLLDQKAGIEWVKRNIKAFGGHPGNITVFGQSAGGRSIVFHLASPLTKGLFKRAIVQSAGGLTPAYAVYQTLREAERKGADFLGMLGVKNIEEARKIDASALLEKSIERIKHQRWNPCIDGYYVCGDPVEEIRNGRHRDVPVMVGGTTIEFMVRPTFASIEEFKAYAVKEYGSEGEHYMELCDPGHTNDPEVISKNAAFSGMELGSRLWGQTHASRNMCPVYAYRFGPEIPGDAAGPFHCSELWFTFETLARCWRPFKGSHYDLARMMCNYWTNFAKNGCPNGPDADGTYMPEWLPYTDQSPNLMFFGSKPQMESSSGEGLMDFIVRHMQL